VLASAVVFSHVAACAPLTALLNTHVHFEKKCQETASRVYNLLELVSYKEACLHCLKNVESVIFSS